jgi:plastocyanin
VIVELLRLDSKITKPSIFPFMQPFMKIPLRLRAACLVLTLNAIFPLYTAHAQAQWHATAGAQNSGKGHQAIAFLPNEIWIHAGDSITWTFDADEIHTVTFLKAHQDRPPFFVGCPGFSSNPATFDGSTCVTTPPLVKGSTFTVNFPVAGNFKLTCLVHPNMTGVIHVFGLSQPLPHDQAFYDARAADERQDLLLEPIDQDAGRDNQPNQSHNPGVAAGIGKVAATAGGSERLSVMRFLNDNIEIHAGQTVEWTNLDPVAPHTITFGTEPPPPFDPPSPDVTVDKDGARHAVISSPSDSTHSGFIIAAPQERTGLRQAPLGVTRFRVTFPNAGTFPYICAIHDNLGMKGTVVVLP